MRTAVLGTLAALAAVATTVDARIDIEAQCRYDAASREWVREKVERSERFTDFSDRIGLFWIRWRDDRRPHTRLIVSGPVTCNDLMIGPPPRPDMIKACVPSANSARAEHVPDPAIHCR